MNDRHTADTINSDALDQLYDSLDGVRALQQDLQGITGARWIAEALSKILDPPGPAATQATQPVRQTDTDPDDPPVQCWHTEANTPCDWNVCNQPERLAAGDYGTDPREQH